MRSRAFNLLTGLVAGVVVGASLTLILVVREARRDRDRSIVQRLIR